MKSRQKSWRRFNDLIPEKDTSSLRENLKAMRNDIQNSSKTENKHTSMIPMKKDCVIFIRLLCEKFYAYRKYTISIR